jgi:hypothetical protein
MDKRLKALEEENDRLREMVLALWDTPGMPGFLQKMAEFTGASEGSAPAWSSQTNPSGSLGRPVRDG